MVNYDSDYWDKYTYISTKKNVTDRKCISKSNRNNIFCRQYALMTKLKPDGHSVTPCVLSVTPDVQSMTGYEDQ